VWTSWLKRGGEEVSVDRGAHALAYAFGVMGWLLCSVAACACSPLPCLSLSDVVIWCQQRQLGISPFQQWAGDSKE